jgi:PadR family transcriptional regulator AphA
MKFDEILLALIARAPCSGYDLGRFLATEGQFIRANADQSQIYKTLSRLLKNGLIEFSVEERDGAPDAKVYRLTEHGAEHIQRVSESQYIPPARWQEPDFIARLTCLVPLNPPTVIPLIETELAFRREQISRYRNRDRTVRLVKGRIPIDNDFLRDLFEDSHVYSSKAADSWVAWLENQHKKWTAYLGLDAVKVSLLSRSQ